jgi:predicted RNA binding protein YcfA (HicA-like mRNA interferase family)
MELETNSRRLLALLKAEGFEEVSKKELPLGTVRNIYQQAGLL